MAPVSITLPFDNETYTAYTTSNIEFDTTILRYGYNSLTTPASIIDFDMVTQIKEVKKEQEVLGGTFDKENYTSERVWATAEDGVRVPISIVYRKGIKRDGQPLFYCMDMVLMALPLILIFLPLV